MASKYFELHRQVPAPAFSVRKLDDGQVEQNVYVLLQVSQSLSHTNDTQVDVIGLFYLYPSLQLQVNADESYIRVPVSQESQSVDVDDVHDKHVTSQA